MSTSPLRGKGIWAWRRAGDELGQAILLAQQTGGTHILYKVAQAETYYEDSAPAARRITEAGLTPFAWTWLTLDDPEREAQVVVRAFQDGYQGFVFDMEAPCSRKFEAARRLVRALKSAPVNPEALYLCSFPNISAHTDLPYTEMLEICKGGLMPMSYGSFFAPGDPAPWDVQARRVIDEWTYGDYETWCLKWGFRPPLYPILGPYHDEYGSAPTSPEEFQVWLNRLAAYGPTFVSFYTARAIPDALVPLIRDFAPAEGPVEMPIPASVWMAPLEGAVLYAAPDFSAQQTRALIYRSAAEGVAWRRGSDGRRWLQVRTADGALGWLPERRADGSAAFALTDPGAPPSLPAPPPAPPGHLTYVWTTQEVNFRSQPVVRPDTLIGRLYPGARLKVIEDPALARRKLGTYQWLNVRLEPEGPEGWLAAWYVTDHPPVAEAPPLPTLLRVQSPQVGYLNIRQNPGTNTPIVWRVPDGTILEIQEDPQQALAKVGQEGQWIRVRTPSLHEGYAAAWYLAADVPPDNRRPVEDAPLPFGECAWIFGIHGAGAAETEDFRFLFQGTGRRGWVLFTESIGRHPDNLQPNEALRQKLWDWARSGFGVVIRLNYGYEPAGTLPESQYYGDFAATCRRWVELYLKRPEVPPSHYTWVITIGNEQNNVREHPGGLADPREHITPQLYARAFNLAYRAIKEVLPNATVIPGAVDPYNTTPWVRLGGIRYRPLTYFKEMLDGIVALDGFALHTYTHGPVVDYITHLRVFTDWPLVPGTEHEHYYDFQAYRPFIEAIPAKWRDKPVYITETNHWTVNPDGTGPNGWINRNIGWVQAAYAEIHRWNSTPHAQQIHCLLLYRWQGDEWEIRTKDQIQEDFRQALRNDYRWRK